jgi:hypothetical protein
VRRKPAAWVLAASLVLAGSAWGGCYAKHAARHSERIVREGFDFDDHGPWILLFGPLSLVVAGVDFALGSIAPIHGGVDPREPEEQWFHAYTGAMRAPEEVAILCHASRATWVTGIRDAGAEAWRPVRDEKWHFPVCIEVLPGRFDLEVHYFAREHDDELEQSVSRQAESTVPSLVTWDAQAGRVYRLHARLGPAQASASRPPQRHIPRSRALGTTWWGLEESEWTAEIEPVGSWADAPETLARQRQAWVQWEERRR